MSYLLIFFEVVVELWITALPKKSLEVMSRDIGLPRQPNDSPRGDE